VHESAAWLRTFSIGFAATGKVVDEEILLNLIQSQEKLCNNFGRKRMTIAMGVYRSDLITYRCTSWVLIPTKPTSCRCTWRRT
jgi:phenylalanyl-tRNA synthetase beta chain